MKFIVSHSWAMKTKHMMVFPLRSWYSLPRCETDS